MKSPFPGMDPYLESSRWPDVHATLIALMKLSIQTKLPQPLRARTEERLLVEDDGESLDTDQPSYRADIAVVQSPKSTDAPSYPGSAVANIEPIVLMLETPEIFDRFVQIIDTSAGNRVVTAIELLSPWNKRAGRLNEKYLKKVGDYQRAGVNVVEIDLLRSSRDHLLITRAMIPPRRRAAYMTCVYFAKLRQWCAYPMPLREPLGIIPIPLRPQDPDIGLELQPLINSVYAGGGHDDIDYAQPPTPALTAEDAVWACGLTSAPRLT